MITLTDEQVAIVRNAIATFGALWWNKPMYRESLNILDSKAQKTYTSTEPLTEYKQEKKLDITQYGLASEMGKKSLLAAIAESREVHYGDDHELS